MGTNKPATFDIEPCIGCSSKLYVSWGFALMLRPAWNKVDASGEDSRLKDNLKEYAIYACANCKHPYVLDEGNLRDVSDLVSSEEVIAALQDIQKMPTGAKAKHIDP